ncbi:MAG: 4-hydroxythreonine-4-phosphate dehydrogenase PdxA [Balneolales bacterium]
MIPTIAISIGDFNGVGPEIILKTLYPGENMPYTPLILGHPDILDFYAKTLEFRPDYNVIESASGVQSGKVNVMPIGEISVSDITPGDITRKAGAFAMEALDKGIDLCLAGEVDGLVTAPISKEAIHMAGYEVPGHTEFLAQKTQCQNYLMMLVSNKTKVGLVSTHIPVQEVTGSVTRVNILKQLKTMNKSLKTDFGIADPRIAVLGLNPHAGDGGVIGKEEINIISPTIAEAVEAGINADGPHSADGFFGNRVYENYDCVLAMYHDQGLIPFKTISFNVGVNFSAGLPIIRTSPDHGTAFMIAGQGVANNQSFHEAIDLAIELCLRKSNS